MKKLKCLTHQAGLTALHSYPFTALCLYQFYLIYYCEISILLTKAENQIVKRVRVADVLNIHVQCRRKSRKISKENDYKHKKKLTFVGEILSHNRRHAYTHSESFPLAYPPNDTPICLIHS